MWQSCFEPIWRSYAWYERFDQQRFGIQQHDARETPPTCEQTRYAATAPAQRRADDARRTQRRADEAP